MVGVLLQADSALAEGALVLIVGGLFFVGLVVLLVVVRNLFPERAPPPTRTVVERRLAPTDLAAPGARGAPGEPLAADLEEGRRRAGSHEVTDARGAMDVVARAGVGEPRLLSVRGGDHADVRLYACAECRGTAGMAHAGTDAACGVALGVLDAVFGGLDGGRVTVRETACGRSGSGVCDFRVQWVAGVGG